MRCLSSQGIKDEMMMKSIDYMIDQQMSWIVNWNLFIKKSQEGHLPVKIHVLFDPPEYPGLHCSHKFVLEFITSHPDALGKQRFNNL
jgi:hypothetical protein